MIIDTLSSFHDSDFLINLNFAGKEVISEYFQQQSNIYIAEVIQGELSNLLVDKYNYPHYYNNIFSNDVISIKLIKNSSFSPKQQSEIKRILISFKDFMPKNNNIGEFTSALYSYFMDVKVFKTCEKSFMRDVGDRYPFNKLTYIDLKPCLLELYSKATVEDILLNIEKNQKQFNQTKEEVRIKKEQSKLDLSIEGLVRKMKKHKL